MAMWKGQFIGFSRNSVFSDPSGENMESAKLSSCPLTHHSSRLAM